MTEPGDLWQAGSLGRIGCIGGFVSSLLAGGAVAMVAGWLAAKIGPADNAFGNVGGDDWFADVSDRFVVAVILVTAIPAMIAMIWRTCRINARLPRRVIAVEPPRERGFDVITDRPES